MGAKPPGGAGAGLPMPGGAAWAPPRWPLMGTALGVASGMGGEAPYGGGKPAPPPAGGAPAVMSYVGPDQPLMVVVAGPRRCRRGR